MPAVACIWLMLVAAHFAASQQIVTVGNGRELVAAIEDPAVDRIVVAQPVILSDDDFTPRSIIQLKRNVTITSDPAGPHQVVDFNAKEVFNKISIGAGYNLSLTHLTLKNTRYGPGADVDILAASPDGILHLSDLAKVQTVCPPLVQKQILAYPRDDTVPGTNVITFPDNVMWDGANYTVPDNYSIHYVDFSTRMSLGENIADRGYVVHKNNSWKLCNKVVDPACVAQADPATCVKLGMDEEYYLTHAQPTPTQLSTAAKAGIGVSAAVAAGLVIAAAVMLAVKRRRKQSAKQQKQLLPVHNKRQSGDSSGGSNTGQLIPASSFRPGSSDSTGSGQLMPPWINGSGLKEHLTPPVSLAMPSILKATLTAEQAAELRLGQMIGAGSFGRVFKGWLGAKEVAIKVVHHESKQAARVASEVELMMTLSHRNLVKAFHYVTWGSSGVSVQMSRAWNREHSLDDSANMCSLGFSSSSSGTLGPNNRMLETWIVVELANAGNLQDGVMARNEGVFFHDNQPHMSMILKTLVGVAEGMQWLHSSNTLHGDLKAANVMLTIAPSSQRDADSAAKGDSDAEVEYELLAKVADFGLSRVMCEGVTHLSTNTVGTITHQPPELMKSGRLSKPADVFSFGVLMWEVIMAAHPWKGKMMGEILTSVMVEGERLQFNAVVPKAYVDVAQQCWAEDPSARPTFAQVLVQLQQLLEKDDELQAEVAVAYANAVDAGSNNSDYAAC